MSAICLSGIVCVSSPPIRAKVSDLPLVFDIESIEVSHEEFTCHTTSTTYIDDNFVLVKPNEGKDLQESVNDAIAKVNEYMANNKLQLNPDKLKLMVLTRKPACRMEITIAAEPEAICHSSKVKIFGLKIEENLSWKYLLLDGPQSIAK